ncbi:hypothetical protein BCU70_03375 [Vibrio sp. 10N.286.49.C2]|nr:hypothetical protein BCU70_03375 [Vibrio sp. 10N.286.49.C2]PMH55731.1 hypothetical protein BCU66_08970 [Vibrio sp. 10N.286.49.B1]
MYLLRLPNSVYYTRIVTPLSPRDIGYRKPFKSSLLPRERKISYLRKIDQVLIPHTLFDKAKALSFTEFEAELTDAINQFHQCYRTQLESTPNTLILSGTTAIKTAPLPQNGLEI